MKDDQSPLHALTMNRLRYLLNHIIKISNALCIEAFIYKKLVMPCIETIIYKKIPSAFLNQTNI